MRNLLLFGPFLWVRRVVLFVLVLALLLVLALYIVSHSSLALKKSIALFAPNYNISYEHISGNALSGFEIINPQYNHQSMAKKISLKYNPSTLVAQKISIEDIALDEVNVDVIRALIAQFGDDDSSVDDNSTNGLGHWQIAAKKVAISTKAFEIDGIKIAQAKLNSKALLYKDNILNVRDVALDIQSNLTSLVFDGKIKDNTLLGKGILEPKDGLYLRYKIPVNKQAIKKIDVDLNLTQQNVYANVHTSAKSLLVAKGDDFNLDVNDFVSVVYYDFNSSEFNATSHAIVDTPYAKNIKLKHFAQIKNVFTHHGTIHIPKVKGLDGAVTGLLSNMDLKYHGDKKSIHSIFNSDKLKGTVESPDFKKAQLHLSTRHKIDLKEIIVLPKELQEAKVNVRIDAPLNLKDFSKLNADIKVDSNVVQIDTKVRYNSTTQLDGTIIIPPNSLLKSYSKDVVWKNISVLHTKVRLDKEKILIDLDAKALNSHMLYTLKSDRLKGRIDLATLPINIEGKVNESLEIKTTINSMEQLYKQINQLYTIDTLPKIKGNIALGVRIDKLQRADVTVSAKKLTYHADRKTNHILKDIKLSASIDKDRLLIKSYNVVLNKQKYFSHKEAKINLGKRIEIAHFWLNDTLKIEGYYLSKKKKGNFTVNAQKFHIKDKIADLYSHINLNATIDGNDTVVEGKVTLLEGRVTPDLNSRSFASDSDIVILQELSSHKQSTFMKNLSLALMIETKKPLILKQNGIHIKLKPDLTINKQKHGKLIYLGSVDLDKGSSYIFKEKKFVLAKSAVYFTGDVNKPLLNIKAKYKSLNHHITIDVTGTPAQPNINFSSSPNLSKEQILSVILFDSEVGGDTHSGSEMMRMMGGAMAKAALSDVGVKVDHLSFGEGNSIEVGKKISSRATVIYINGELPKVKLKYNHNSHTESVIGVSRESQSYDIIFKKDF